MDMESVYSLLPQVAATITAIGTIGAFVFAWVIKPFRNAYADHQRHMGQLNAIYKEVKPENGPSMKDKFEQMQSQLANVQGSVNKIDRRQRALLTHDGQPVFEADSSGRCTWVNRAYLRMLNATHEEVMMNGWKNFIFPLDRELVSDEWSSAVGDKREFKLTFRYQTADGEIICCTCDALAIKEDSGELSGYVGIITQHVGLDRCS